MKNNKDSCISKELMDVILSRFEETIVESENDDFIEFSFKDGRLSLECKEDNQFYLNITTDKLISSCVYNLIRSMKEVNGSIDDYTLAVSHVVDSYNGIDFKNYGITRTGKVVEIKCYSNQVNYILDFSQEISNYKNTDTVNLILQTQLDSELIMTTNVENLLNISTLLDLNEHFDMGSLIVEDVNGINETRPLTSLMTELSETFSISFCNYGMKHFLFNSTNLSEENYEFYKRLEENYTYREGDLLISTYNIKIAQIIHYETGNLLFGFVPDIRKNVFTIN